MSGRFAQNDMSSAIMADSKDQAFDPLVDMLNELKGQWDGTPRLATAMQRVAGVPDTEWSRMVFRKWMISAIARIMIPGSKVDTMFILEGNQGFKKSTFFSALLPETRYFSDGVSRVKQDVETIRLIHSGPLIFELGELSGLRKQEVDEIKAFLSARDDHLRPLYEAPRQVKRRCIFVGSTNLNDYLRDSTGGRRFWPVVVTRVIDIQTVETERAQWWAEALAAYGDGSGEDGRGERWWLETQVEHDLARVEQDQRYEEDVWTTIIRAWVARKKVPEPEGGVVTATDQMQQDIGNTSMAGDYVTTAQVLEHAIKMKPENIRGPESKRVESVLRKDGWLPSRIYINRKQTRVWKRPIGE
jgi:predicted P-loop ATPase